MDLPEDAYRGEASFLNQGRLHKLSMYPGKDTAKNTRVRKERESSPPATPEIENSMLRKYLKSDPSPHHPLPTTKHPLSLLVDIRQGDDTG